jgi:hypothetical protein
MSYPRSRDFTRVCLQVSAIVLSVSRIPLVHIFLLPYISRFYFMLTLVHPAMATRSVSFCLAVT